MKTVCLLFILSYSLMVNAQKDFKKEQLKFERVKNAYDEKFKILNSELSKKKYSSDFSMVLNAYKAEGKLEVWLKNKNSKIYSLFKTYDFCAHSGTLGPKIIEGDKQTPEGFYYVNVFNPMSTFHLSLGVNYPNHVDEVRTGKDRKTGGDIYIHGDCVTVGCIPLTDDKIKELYVLAVEAKNNGQEKIQVNIFPFKMTSENLVKYSKEFPLQKEFWKNIKPGFDYFEKNKNEIKFKEKDGKYVFN